jgi:hypothetical protein
MIMSEQAIVYYAKKFWPQLREDYAVLCVKAVLKVNGWVQVKV